MTDVFGEVRERVSAQDAARHYGAEFDRRGWCRCPFHDDRHASMSFKNGRFRCWSCNVSGDAVDFTARLFGLEPMAAVRKLDADFRLGLPLDKPPDKDTVAAVQRRRETMETYRLFEQWRDGMIRRLNQCFREAHFIMKTLETPADLDRLTDAQTLAIREQARVEYYSDVLTGGTMEDMVQIFRGRGMIEQLCEKILRSTPPKSEAA